MAFRPHNLAGVLLPPIEIEDFARPADSYLPSGTLPARYGKLRCALTILDVGCGTRKIESSAVGIDVHPRSAADIIWDLDDFPWPLDNQAFDRIYMSHIIEHVRDVTRTMAEVHRVARDRADVFVVTPHFSSHNSYTDPTHLRHLAARSFQYFTGEDFATFGGSDVRFTVEQTELMFGKNFFLDGIGRLLARRNLEWYERHAAWVFPAQDIRCHLRVV
jgi:SAM-dependent methyltransferase